MNKINILDIDGCSLKTFLTVLEECSVSKAAVRLGVTQSAVSHTLDKLRTLIDDPLFTRSGRGITPTIKALSLREPIENIVDRISSLSIPYNFNPSSDKLAFTIACNDFPTGFIFPTLLKNLSKEGIFPKLRFIPAGIPSVNLSRTSDCQMMITPALPKNENLNHTTLLESKMVCFYDKTVRNPPSSLQEYLESKYVDVRFSNTESSQQVLPRSLTSKLNQSSIDVSNFNAIADFIKGTEFITTQISVMSFGCLKGLALAPLPIETKPLKLNLVWHERYDNDPAHHWFRKKIIETVRFITEGK